MKKRLLLGICACGCLSLGVYLNIGTNVPSPHSSDLTLADVEAAAINLDEGSGGDRIICKCDSWYDSGKGCRVDYHGSKCAQGQPGSNISCADYDSNCS